MRNTLIILFLLVISVYGKAQKVALSGEILDAENGETLIGATILLVNQQGEIQGCVSDNYGIFSFNVAKGQYQMKVQYVGYQPKDTLLSLFDNQKIVLKMKEISATIKEIQVVALKNNVVKTNDFEVTQLTMKEIRSLPLALGQADLIKAVQLQNGVKTVGDGGSGMFIRGGSADQNLLLIDEAPVYNPSHLFGLVSVFNPDAINSIKLYKGNIPAQYGGRASGVLECTMREGNNQTWKTSGSINPLAAGFSVELPLQKEKTTMILTARRSLFDLFTPINKKLPLQPSFYDFNFKINHRLNEKDRLFFSVYNGSDFLKSSDGLQNQWGNLTFTGRWNRQWSNRLFMNFALIKSNYNNKLNYVSKAKKFQWLTGINDLSGKVDFSYYVNPKNTIKFGINIIQHHFIPGEQPDSLSSISRVNALESALYCQQDIQVTPYLGLNYGLRWSLFQNNGKGVSYVYAPDYQFVTKRINEKGIYHTYQNPEPRLAINFSPQESWSIKLAATRTAQYMQVLQNSPLAYSALETWFPATSNTKPLIANTLSIGFFKNINTNYAFSLEAYKKKFYNQIDFIDHAHLISNPYIEAEIRTGTAQAQGIEVGFDKKEGRLTGNISYTYSRVTRLISGINKGKTYAAPYDMPHDIRIVAQYQVSSRLSLGALWMFNSGRPVTLPVGFYSTQNSGSVPIYTVRNGGNYPNYHRLDCTMLWSSKPSVSRRYSWTINGGLYNAYARLNPLGYEFASFDKSGKPKVFAYTLFKIFPNIGFTFKY